MSDVSDRTLERVRSLLNLASHEATPAAEAEQARERAYEIMTRYQIDQALLVDLGEQDPEAPTWREITTPAPYAKYKHLVLNAVAGHFQCKPIVIQEGRVLTTRVYGAASDLEAVEMLYTQLLLHATRDMHRDGPGNAFRHVKSWRATFLIEFANEVNRRLKALRQAAERDADGDGRAALVLADKLTAALNALAKDFPFAVERAKVRARGAGGAAGRRSGRSADLGQPRLSRRHQKQLS